MTLPELAPRLGRRAAAALVCLTALGFLGNVFHIEVFLSFYYLFGNLPALLVALELGPLWGAVSALGAASYTVHLFGHPYALLWLVGEAAFVGAMARRRPSGSAIVWDALYWMALGGPLIWLVYTQAMGTSGQLAHIVALKHAVNGLANASVASLLLSLGWPARLLTGRRDRRALSMQQATFQLLAGMVVLPALAFAMMHGRQTAARVEREAGRDLGVRARLLASRFSARLDDRGKAGDFVARLARASGTGGAAVGARAVMASIRDVAEISLVDPIGRETSLGARAPGARGPAGARIVIGAGWAPDLLSADAPIAPRVGAVVKLDPAGLESLLRAFLGADDQSATVLTGDLVVAATTRPDLEILDRYDPRAGAEVRRIGPEVLLRTPRATELLPQVERWRRSAFVGVAAVPGTRGWSVVVEEPMAPHQRAVHDELTRLLWLVLGLLYASVGLSSFFAGRLSRPLAALATATTDLPRRLQGGEEPSWPATWISEIARLVENSQGMARELRARFADGEAARSTLEQRVEERTAELAGANRALRQEVESRRMAEEEVRRLNAHLERRVAERTVQLEAEVAQRRASEDEARRAAAEVEDLYNNAPCGYHSLGPDGTFLRINDTELGWLGYAREELVGRKTFGDLLSPESLPLFTASFGRFKEKGRVNDLEFELVRKDGTLLPVVLSATAIRDGAGAYVMSRSTLFDNTERRRAEQAIAGLNRALTLRADELAAANEELEAFVYSVSHDLRAPLRHVDGYSQALLEDFGDRLGSEGGQYCERLRAASQHMGQLIDDLLNLSRVARGELTREAVDLSALARGVAERLQRQEPGRRVDVEIQEGLSAQGDARLLGVVLENLLGNAWKYTSHKAEAHIAFGEADAGGAKAFFVRDDGAGFDMRYVGKLFQPFQRLHSREEFEGSGIGLATVRRVVRRHGGTVWAEGEPGRGATFWFQLEGER